MSPTRIAALVALLLAGAPPAHADSQLHRYGPYSAQWTPQGGSALCLTHTPPPEGLAIAQNCVGNTDRQEWLFTQSDDGRGFVVQNKDSHRCLRAQAGSEQVPQAVCDRRAPEQYWTVASRDSGRTTSVCATDGRCLTVLDPSAQQPFRKVALRATTAAVRDRQGWTMVATGLGRSR
ncbi:RICIN domain-containing protein [Actinokineospora terrae]|uniref:Ricin-type beta-trefoil lectin domain-containing protein n=1 Tax=Actinokineospora terrae TaxID=155974 RepID=A0A1H9KT74_9PSEU|nr:RICIN domain-containing protein [Actinokineospora terrae]SER02376.1 Ricin-type beta-trefoil lectin domain-containing protein [Actinokineospora terrae]